MKSLTTAKSELAGEVSEDQELPRPKPVSRSGLRPVFRGQDVSVEVKSTKFLDYLKSQNKPFVNTYGTQALSVQLPASKIWTTKDSIAHAQLVKDVQNLETRIEGLEKEVEIKSKLLQSSTARMLTMLDPSPQQQTEGLSTLFSC